MLCLFEVRHNFHFISKLLTNREAADVLDKHGHSVGGMDEVIESSKHLHFILICTILPLFSRCVEHFLFFCFQLLGGEV